MEAIEFEKSMKKAEFESVWQEVVVSEDGMTKRQQILLLRKMARSLDKCADKLFAEGN